METFNLPKYSKVIYQKQSTGAYFIQSAIEAQETPINRLSIELRLAPVGAAQIKSNASKMLLDRPLKGIHQFRTGLQDTNYANWYLGNDFEWQAGQKLISLMLFHFLNGDTVIEVYYFYRFDKRNSFLRQEFAHSVIPFLMQKMAA